MGNQSSNPHKQQNRSSIKKGNQVKLDSKTEELLLRKTKLSKDEIHRIFEEFNANNPDGLLNRVEFRKMYKKLHASQEIHNFDNIEKMVFRAFDLDHNSLLTFEEFLVSYFLASKGDRIEKLEFAFRFYDVDQSGYLTRDEIKKVLNCMMKLYNAEETSVESLAAEVTSQLDVVQDGRITRGLFFDFYLIFAIFLLIYLHNFKDEFVNSLLENYSLRIMMEPFS
jgi:Ca2+-binding EF-hand superfamily protein